MKNTRFFLGTRKIRLASPSTTALLISIPAAYFHHTDFKVGQKLDIYFDMETGNLILEPHKVKEEQEHHLEEVKIL
jgi:hypothetical protein